MNKALKILKEIEEYYSLILARELATRKPVKTIDDRINSIQEAIAEIEEAMKPKSCSICKHSFYWKEIDRLECTKLDKPYCYNCEEELSMVEVTGDFYCNRYEPKE